MISFLACSIPAFTWHGLDVRHTARKRVRFALHSRPRCFETFPFPRPTPAQEAAIAAAAKELNELRERWLNPPEWTVEKILEFPGTVRRPVVPLHQSLNHQIRTLNSQLPAGSKRSDDRSTLNRLSSLSPARAQRRRLRRQAEKAHAHEPLQRAPRLARSGAQKLDAAVAAAYGFPTDLTDEQILEKLLALNLGRAAEEAKAAKVKKSKTSREKHAEEMI